jgi:hypothetical protein
MFWMKSSRNGSGTNWRIGECRTDWSFLTKQDQSANSPSRSSAVPVTRSSASVLGVPIG